MVFTFPSSNESDQGQVCQDFLWKHLPIDGLSASACTGGVASLHHEVLEMRGRKRVRDSPREECSVCPLTYLDDSVENGAIVVARASKLCYVVASTGGMVVVQLYREATL